MDSRFPQKQETSEKLKAKQYGVAALNCILATVIMTVIRLIWGSVMLGSGADGIPLGMAIFYVRNLVLLWSHRPCVCNLSFYGLEQEWAVQHG